MFAVVAAKNGHISSTQLVASGVSPAENHFDLELRSKVFFFTDSGSADITFE